MNKRNAVVIGVIIVALFALAIYGNFRAPTRSEQPVGDDAVPAPEEHLESPDEELPQVETDHGVIIIDVEPDGPADQAGVVRGDILLEIDDQPVENLADIREILADHDEGDIVELTVLHGDDVRLYKAKLETRERQTYLGISGYAAAPTVRRMTVHEEWIPQPMKPMILEVFPESPAEEAGLREGDVILAIDGKDLEPEDSLAEIIAAYAPGDTIAVKARRLGEAEPEGIDVELSSHPELEEKAYLGIRYMPIPDFPTHFFKGEDWPRGEFHFFALPEGRMRLVLPYPGFGPGEGRFIFPPSFERSYPFPEGKTIAGVIVKGVVEGSPADQAGLQEGDIIGSIDGELAGEAKDFSREIASRKPDDEVQLTVFRSGEEKALEITVRLGQHPDKAGIGFLGILTGPSIFVPPYVEDDLDAWFDSFLKGLGPLFQGKINLHRGEA